MPARLTLEKFLEKAKRVHGDEYDYSLVEYKNNSTKVKIICKEHGVFEQKPNTHVDSKNGCPVCRYIKSAKSNGDDIDSFLEKARKLHGDKYDYSLVEYVKSQVKIKIICPVHGVFEQRPQDHLRFECNKCAYEKDTERKKGTTKDFIIKANKVHEDKYDYSLVEYVNSKTNVKIICPIHGIFEQRPSDHIRGVGCPTCGKESRGEREIRELLIENGIKFKPQKTFSDCVYKNKLRFDFYLIDYDILIEFDGKQHFEPIKEWGGEKSFFETKKRDEIKNDYCLKNNKKLYRISYEEDIEKKLNDLIKEVCFG